MCTKQTHRTLVQTYNLPCLILVRLDHVSVEMLNVFVLVTVSLHRAILSLLTSAKWCILINFLSEMMMMISENPDKFHCDSHPPEITRDSRL